MDGTVARGFLSGVLDGSYPQLKVSFKALDYDPDD